MKIVAFIVKSFIFSTDRDLVSVMVKNKQILWELCQILLLYALWHKTGLLLAHWLEQFGEKFKRTYLLIFEIYLRQ